jgi:hypothetical protein
MVMQANRQTIPKGWQDYNHTANPETKSRRDDMFLKSHDTPSGLDEFHPYSRIVSSLRDCMNFISTSFHPFGIYKYPSGLWRKIWLEHIPKSTFKLSLP